MRCKNRFYAKYMIAILLLFVVLSASGCVPSHVNPLLAVGQDPVPDKISERHDKKDTLVVIRFPFAVKPEAASLYTEFYMNRGLENIFFKPDKQFLQLRWWLSENKHIPVGGENAQMDALSKTTYLAVSLYNSLKQSLPEDSVKLLPVAIGIGGVANTDGVARPGEPAPKYLTLEQGHQIPPAPILVDVFAYVNAHQRMGMHFPSTFGDMFTPFVTIRTSPEGSPSTLGGIALPDTFFSCTRKPAAFVGVAGGLGATFVDYLTSVYGVPPDFFSLTSQNYSSKYENEKLMVLPSLRYQQDEELLNKQVGVNNVNETPLDPLLKQINSIILNALSPLDYEKATRRDRIEFIEIYDPSLAIKMSRGEPLDDIAKKKLIALKAIERAEWKFNSNLSEVLFKKTFLGSWGGLMRENLAAENKLKQETMNQWQRSQLMGAMSIMSTGFAGMSGIASATNPTQMLQAQLGGMQTLMMQTMQMVKDQHEATKAMAELNTVFFQNTSAILPEPQSFFVDILGEDFKIPAKTLEDLRIGMKSKYIKKFGSL